MSTSSKSSSTAQNPMGSGALPHSYPIVWTDVLQLYDPAAAALLTAAS
jgi:hypothetical protein